MLFSNNMPLDNGKTYAPTNSRVNYDVLECLPKSTLLWFYTRSLLVGFYVVIKWTLYFVWKSFSESSIFVKRKNQSRQDDRSSIEYYASLHDKPPLCLVDNRIGLQSYVKLKGTKLHYVEAGNNNDKFILLLHGFPDCWLGWHNQIKELSRFFRVVAVDLKGFNDSDKPQWRSAYTPEKICNELLQFLRSLGVNSATIIGHDLGAVIGWTFVHMHPDNVDKFISVSAPHPNLMWNNLQAKSPINDSWLKFVQLPYLPERCLSRQDSQFLDKSMPHIQMDGKSSRNGIVNGDDLIATQRNAYKYVFSQRNDWTGPLNYYRNFPFYRVKAGETIRCPCLIITGSEDTFCRLDLLIKSTEYCDNFLVRIIEKAGHWPHQEMPDEFNSRVLNFLVGQRANQPATALEKSQKGIMGRMLGAVSNGVKIGGFVLDSVHQRTNEMVIQFIAVYGLSFANIV